MKKLVILSLAWAFVFTVPELSAGSPTETYFNQEVAQNKVTILGGGYSKDTWKVFYHRKEIKEASANSFTYLDGEYGKDNWKVFYKGTPPLKKPLPVHLVI
ncbi:MAG: DKNYY domain-containing protein [Bacteroides sp.]|nr:DKNYY domain-containing protein [Bacteroides sp.]